MPKLTVLSYPNPSLRVISPEVTCFDAHFRDTVQQLFSIMEQEDGLGLAAPQVGINARFFVINQIAEQDPPRCLVNPIILHQEGSVLSEEACLSLPGIYAKVNRAKKITVQYQDAHGKDHQLTTDGLTAQCIQHELDHLNGVLFIDHLSKLKRALLLKKYQKLHRLAS